MSGFAQVQIKDMYSDKHLCTSRVSSVEDHREKWSELAEQITAMEAYGILVYTRTKGSSNPCLPYSTYPWPLVSFEVVFWLSGAVLYRQFLDIKSAVLIKISDLHHEL